MLILLQCEHINSQVKLTLHKLESVSCLVLWKEGKEIKEKFKTDL